MDLQKLHDLLMGCLSEKEDSPDTTVVQIHNLKVAVNTPKAQANKDSLKQLLAGYEGPHALSEGPSYIEVGAVIGSQRTAFILFAVGKALGFWDVITPATLGITGKDANDLAGSGMIMLSGCNLA
ncbi:hypothetical protein KKC62_01960 [Patescibacteria group bacterium]|nr:hypothetical protein [Patescibacteria group bacterium]MBU1952946.1 hypothetical protein [Patescibacteria group bacterium]